MKARTKNLGWSKPKIFGRLFIDIVFIVFAARFCLGWWHIVTAGKLQASEFMFMGSNIFIVIAEFTFLAILILISIRRLTGDWTLVKEQYGGG